MVSELSPLGAGSLSLLELEEESDWFSSSSNIARRSPEVALTK
jgi:hypothetical protein